MTLFDIFYQHTEWWCNPDLGHDTQGKYGDVLKEMEDCALDYARSIKDTGDRWKRVIENETRELCLPNHYSWNLRGDKKEWHDTVVRDFLIRIRKAIEHCYGYNFTELPKSILPSYGIYCDEWPTNRKPQQKHIEAPQQPIGGNSGELAGNGKENAPEGENVPPIENYIELTPELQTTDKKAEKVFTAAYNEEWITKRNLYTNTIYIIYYKVSYWSARSLAMPKKNAATWLKSMLRSRLRPTRSLKMATLYHCRHWNARW